MDGRLQQQRKTGDRRQQILDCAMSILASNGYASLSIERIASTLGISKGNITYHFTTKHILVREMFKKLVDISKERRISLQGDAAMSSIERFEAYIENEFSILTSDQYDAQVWETYAFSSHDKFVRDIVYDIGNWYLANIAELLKPVRPDLDTENRQCLSKIIFALTRGMLVFIGSSRSKTKQHDLDREMAQRFVVQLAAQWTPERGGFDHRRR